MPAGGGELHHVGQPRLVRQRHVQGESRWAGASAKDRCMRKIEVEAGDLEPPLVLRVRRAAVDPVDQRMK